MARLPNIVLLHSHDCGRAIAPYGWPVQTPHLLGLAREGVLFRNAFSAAPTCAPSRAAMLTGEYPHQCGMFGLPGGQGWTLNNPERHLVHTLNEAGFCTALAGVQHETNHADITPLGYQLHLDRHTQLGEHYPDTLDRVEEFLSAPMERPFFLSIGLDEPHRNNIARPDIGIGNESARFSKTCYYDPERLDWRYTAPPPWLPDLPEIRKDTESLHEGVRILDAQVGRILNLLHHRGLSDNTLLIATTDHGIEFPGGKKTLTDRGTGVFLMMRGPRPFQGGKVVDHLVSHLDIYPTILDWLGLPRKSWLQGKSLLESAANPGGPSLHDAVFTEQNYHGPLEALRAVRTPRHKLVLRHNAMGNRMRHDGPSGPLMESLGAYDRLLGNEELFDLYLDPMEACNRSDDPAYAAVKADLRDLIERWMAATGDCFPSGVFPPVPTP